MKINVLTLFPGIFEGFLNETLIKRALKDQKIEINLVNIRDFANDKHHTTDDTPYGGGPGMVMKIEPIYKALQSVKRNLKEEKVKTVLMSPKGKQFTQVIAQDYSKLDSLTLICGRYEGIDQRVSDYLTNEELSIGPYVLSGGEVPAMVVIETLSRFIPGVLGNQESLKEETFSLSDASVFDYASSVVEYPQYTKPPEFNGWRVPEVLLSGNHEEIRKWREENSKRN